MKMKKINYLLFAVLLLLAACKKKDDTPNPYGGNNGRVAFLLIGDYGVGDVTIYLDGTSLGKITHYSTVGSSECDNDLDVHTLKEAGTYNWEARAANGDSWNGTITIAKGICSAVEVTIPGRPIPEGYTKQGMITIKGTSPNVCFKNGNGTTLETVFIKMNDLLLNGAFSTVLYGNTPVCGVPSQGFVQGYNYISISSGTTVATNVSVTDAFSTQTFTINSNSGAGGAYVIKVE